MENSKSVIILSGGMDSTTLLYDLIAEEGPEIYALTFNYGQRHKKETEYAKRTCEKLNISQKIIDITSINELLQGSALTSNIEIPQGHYEDENMKQTVVPNRNMILLSLAVGYAVSIGANRVLFGAHAGDHTIYPDCRPEFVSALNEVTKISNFLPVEVLAPYLDKDKGDIALIGKKLGVDYSLTWTCYNPVLRRPHSSKPEYIDKITAWKPNTKELKEDWVIGFFEGEGTFGGGWADKKEGNQYASIAIYQKDSFDLLNKLKDFFGFGSVSALTSDSQMGQLDIGGTVNCQKIAYWLNGKLKLEKRQKQFNHWIKRFDLLNVDTDLHPCEKCGACVERAEAFKKANLSDPLL